MTCVALTIRNGEKKIIQATLEAVKLYGIHAVTHRKIATLAGVPLGSMTYYFSGIDELLLEAFSRFTEIMSRQYQAFLAMLVMLQAHARLSPI